MRRLLFTRLSAAAALALTLSSAGAAFAGDTSTAEALFRDGLDLMKKENYPAACEAFAGSNESDPSPGTEINLALCFEKQNKNATAWGWYRTAAGLADQRGQKDRAETARKEAARLEPKLHKLVIVVKGQTEGLSVVRDGAAIPSAIIGKEVPVDPGEHVIEVTAKGKKPFKTAVKAWAAGTTFRVEVPPLEDAPEEKAAPAPMTAGSDVRPPSEAGPNTGQRNVGMILGGAGIVGVVAAVSIQVFFAIPEAKKRDDAQSAANTDTDPAIRQAHLDGAASHDKAAKGDQLAAIITGAGGVVLVGIGAALILTSGGKSKTATTMVTPLIGTGLGGAGLSGTF